MGDFEIYPPLKGVQSRFMVIDVFADDNSIMGFPILNDRYYPVLLPKEKMNFSAVNVSEFYYTLLQHSVYYL